VSGSGENNKEFFFQVFKVMVRASLHQIPPIRSNELVSHLRGIFLFVELVGSVPFHSRTLELHLSVERYHLVLQY
jgi:hypothetical protein